MKHFSQIKSEGVTVFGVGVGGDFDKLEVNEIASDPDVRYSFVLTDFSALSSVLRDSIANQACLVSTVVQVLFQIALF